jgi:hypothetical protein
LPGRTPQAAFDAFIGPIEGAVSCLGQGKIVCTAGRSQPGGVRAWSLNGDAGMTFGGGWHFEAQMHYEVIPAEEPAGEWRVTTRAYRYRIARSGVDLVRIHWHPMGRSTYRDPHVHLPALTMAEGETAHLPVGRITFEDAVEWAIGLGIKPARSDWRSVLDRSRGPHVQHRSWHISPGSA